MKLIPNKQMELLDIWKNNIFREFSITEIMKHSNKKTKTWVFTSLKLFVKYNILISKRRSNIDFYSINLNNPISLQFLQYLEAQENISFSKLDMISELINKIPVKEYSLIVFGSYAVNKNTKDSDIDIAFLIENREKEREMKPYVNDVKLNYHVKIDEHYFTFEEIIKMLLREEENLGKQIIRKHKIFYNANIYYQILKEAYKNGYRQ